MKLRLEALQSFVCSQNTNTGNPESRNACLLMASVRAWVRQQHVSRSDKKANRQSLNAEQSQECKKISINVNCIQM